MKLNLQYKNKENIFTEVENEGVPYLIFNNLEETGLIKQAFTTRLGGVSTGDCASMNISIQRGDLPENVLENTKRLSKAVGVKEDSLVFSAQTHTTNVVEVTRENYKDNFADVDGMITKVPGLTLVTFYADCVPLYFVDPVKKAIGLSHSGWRGTVHKMGKVTVEAMTKAFHSNPKDILVGIGPSICQDCYEVSEDVIKEVNHAFKGYQEKDLYYQKDNGKYQLNLWRANELVLEEAGILKENLATTNLCTCCNSDFLFSHRASKGKRGNLSALLALKEEI
ncbi:MAG TPA: peptidoglycan editing factor PgeF [Candidatus Dorea intestinavium]|nr:peptidoglycan editing factor PgeF [Candidatus Dorea intestinavium]